MSDSLHEAVVRVIARRLKMNVERANDEARKGIETMAATAIADVRAALRDMEKQRLTNEREEQRDA